MRLLGALTAVLLVVASGCSERPKSFKELKRLGIFPPEAASVWRLDGEPASPDEKMDGYVHALYDHTELYGSLKVWVIDKGTPKGAEEWLSMLFSGKHNARTVAPLAPSEAVSGGAREFYSEFLNHPVEINGIGGFERYEEREVAGHIGFHYMAYFVRGRYVVGAEDLHMLEDLDAVRANTWSLLKALNLPGK